MCTDCETHGLKKHGSMRSDCIRYYKTYPITIFKTKNIQILYYIKYTKYRNPLKYIDSEIHLQFEPCSSGLKKIVLIISEKYNAAGHIQLHIALISTLELK